MALTACGQDEAAPLGKATAAVGDGDEGVQTFVSKYIEIDELNGGPGDANLVLDDPIRKYPVLPNTPVPADEAWADWNAVDAEGNPVIPPATHKLPDTNNPADDRDYSAFPRSNECVKDAKVLSKMDLTYVGVANNKDFAYLAVQRANNNGDAGYYWLFTKDKPAEKVGEAPCRADETRLVYRIQEGDVLLAGHFQPSATPLLQAYVATTGVDVTLGAVEAIDFLSGIWVPSPSSIAAAAVNETNADPGIWGAAGVDKQALDNGMLEPWLFAEAAVKTELFTGGSICGARFYGSVITRSSGAGGTTPDLKDLAGPKQFIFGDVSATAGLTPSCSQQFGYSAKLFGFDKTEIASPSCSWSFKDATTDQEVASSTTCSGTLTTVSGGGALPPGTYKATVTLTDPATGCATTKDAGTVDVYAPLGATPTLVPGNCDKTFTYAANATGGSGTFAYAWTFSPTPVEPGAPWTSASGTITVGTPGIEYTGSLRVTDQRTDLPPGSCYFDGSAKVTPYGPLSVNLTPNFTNVNCADAIKYTANASGGSGTYTYNWGGLPGCASSSNECTIDPSNDTFCATIPVQVVLQDLVCGNAPSEIETYTKVTSATATDN